jgi:hypothetical protein
MFGQISFPKRPTAHAWLRITAGGAFFSFLLGTVMALSATGMIQIADLVSRAEQYDKQIVTVVGRVDNFQVASTRDGHIGFGFLLKDAHGTVKVVGLGKVAIHNGEQVIVEGVFNRLRQVGRAIVFNEIKADRVQSLDRLTPDLVG